MSKKQSIRTDPAGLRARAEAQLKARAVQEEVIPGAEPERRLLHELQVHLIELEMQNEELCQAREEVETVLQRYAELYDFAPTSCFSLDSNGAISKANFAAAGILKMERAKLVGRRFGDFVAASLRPAFDSFINKMAGEKARASCETELVNAEGETLFALIEATADQSGYERHLAVMDISERKRLELQLQDTRSNLDSILNAIPDLLFELGLDGRYYNFWSPHTELLAAPPEAFLGKRVSEVLPPETAAICLAALQEADKNGYSMGRQYELVLRGERRWFELSIARKEEVYADGPHFVALCRDITERKQAEQNMLALYTAIEQSPVSVAITDADANIQYVNPRFTKATGYTSAEMLGQNPRMFQSGQTPIETYQDMWGKITRNQVWNGELLNKRKNGEIYWEEIHIAPVTDSAGNINNYVCLMNDITRRKQAELVNADLLRQNRALAKRMFTSEEEERRKIARELHDELGQWLTAIQAEAEAIRSLSGKSAPILASVEAIGQSAGAMHEVIHRMVHSLRPSLLDTLGLLDSLRELEKQWCQPRLGIACDFVLAGDLDGLSDDLKITIFRLVQEALNNIASYARANHVSVRLRRVAGDAPNADIIFLEVEDDGVGFDPALLTKGTGVLGMRERAIAAGGEFELVSAPGQGVHISIKLPLENPDVWCGIDRRKT